MRTKEKSVGFFQVALLAQGQLRRPVVDWREAMARVAELPLLDRTHEGVIYDPQVTDDAVLLGVHQLLKPDFMSTVDAAGGSVADLMDQAQAEGISRLAHSTAVYFMSAGNAVAIATGTNNSPKPPKVIVDFLEAHMPQGRGEHWVGHPVMDTDKIRRLREESHGVASFTTQITTVRSLFDPDDSDGVVRFADQVAQRVGGDVVVDISVRLAPQSRSRSAAQRLRDLVISDLPRVAANPQSKSKVTAIMGGDVQEELNLVAARLAATIEVDPAVSESLRFSALMGHLRDVGGEMEDRVRELLEG